MFVADMALHSFALMAAAEDATAAYTDFTKDDWKPYERHHTLPRDARLPRWLADPRC